MPTMSGGRGQAVRWVTLTTDAPVIHQLPVLLISTSQAPLPPPSQALYKGDMFLDLSKLSPLSLSVLSRASLISQLVKNLPAMEETPVQLLGREDLLEKG